MTHARRRDAAQLRDAIAAYAAGDAAAASAITGALLGPMRDAAHRLLSSSDADVDDVVQDAALAVLAYIRKNGGFRGDLIAFAVTVTRNRCRNLLLWRSRHPTEPLEPMADWLSDRARSPLDVLIEEERRQLLQAGLDDLDDMCRNLLRRCYLDEEPIADLRRSLGFLNVQAVYLRRSLCLGKLTALVKNRLLRCSPLERDLDAPSREGWADPHPKGAGHDTE